MASIFGLTPGDGPFYMGVMGGDLVLSELEAYLELQGPSRPDDITNMEIASRGKHIRHLGMLVPSGNGSIAALRMDNVRMSALKFSESGEGSGWKWWLYNMGPALTTGATWSIVSQSFVRWNPSG